MRSKFLILSEICKFGYLLINVFVNLITACETASDKKALWVCQWVWPKNIKQLG